MTTAALPTPEQIKRAISDESRTLTQVLASLGMTHVPTGRGYRHRVVLASTIVMRNGRKLPDTHYGVCRSCDGGVREVKLGKIIKG